MQKRLHQLEIRPGVALERERRLVGGLDLRIARTVVEKPGRKRADAPEEPLGDVSPGIEQESLGIAGLREHEHQAERGEKGHQACPFPEAKRRTALEQPHERADAPQEPRVGEACHESERQIPQNPAQKGLF